MPRTFWTRQPMTARERRRVLALLVSLAVLWISVSAVLWLVRGSGFLGFWVVLLGVGPALIALAACACAAIYGLALLSRRTSNRNLTATMVVLAAIPIGVASGFLVEVELETRRDDAARTAYEESTLPRYDEIARAVQDSVRITAIHQLMNDYVVFELNHKYGAIAKRTPRGEVWEPDDVTLDRASTLPVRIDLPSREEFTPYWTRKSWLVERNLLVFWAGVWIGDTYHPSQ